jgi:hypothetical protein
VDREAWRSSGVLDWRFPQASVGTTSHHWTAAGRRSASASRSPEGASTPSPHHDSIAALSPVPPAPPRLTFRCQWALATSALLRDGGCAAAPSGSTGSTGYVAVGGSSDDGVPAAPRADLGRLFGSVGGAPGVGSGAAAGAGAGTSVGVHKGAGDGAGAGVSPGPGYLSDLGGRSDHGAAGGATAGPATPAAGPALDAPWHPPRLGSPISLPPVAPELTVRPVGAWAPAAPVPPVLAVPVAPGRPRPVSAHPGSRPRTTATTRPQSAASGDDAAPRAHSPVVPSPEPGYRPKSRASPWPWDPWGQGTALSVAGEGVEGDSGLGPSPRAMIKVQGHTYSPAAIRRRVGRPYLHTPVLF